MEVGQIEGAISLLEKGLDSNPNRVDIMEPLAFAYSASGDPVMAAITFKRIADLVAEEPEYLLYSAESLLEADDRKGAVARYEEYLEVRPEDRAIWITLAELQADSGRMGEALEAFLAAERIQTRPVQQVAIGQLYLRSQNLAQAQSWFARALEGDADVRDEALLGLLETAIRSKRFSEAEQLLRQIDAEYPGRVDQSSLDGVRDQLAEWRRRREAALEALAALEEKAAEEAAARESSAEPEEAVVAEAVETIPEPVPEAVAESESEPEGPPAADEPVREVAAQPRPEDHLAWARQYREQGDTEEAIRRYKQALVKNDNQPVIWAELSELYLETGQNRWAQATANEALRRDPQNPKLFLQFLRAAQRTMDPQQVINEAENGYRQFPEQPEIVLVLARAYADQGNARNAYMLFRKFLDLVPLEHPERANVEFELQQLGR
ncbi:MAG: tetratricopeptide repeat protein [Puniceicoccaceae bacterium]